MSERTYGQFCGLARALDLLGDRWSLLIVRELLISPRRYGELREGLPGIATNLLADRLRTLQQGGVIERRLGERGGVVYALTPWGAELRDAVAALIRWSLPLMAAGRHDDAFAPHWLEVSLPALLHGRTASPPVAVALDIGAATALLALDEHGPHVEVLSGGETETDRARRPGGGGRAGGDDARFETRLRADPEIVLGLAAGAVSVGDAIAAGAVSGGDQPLYAIFDPAKSSP